MIICRVCGCNNESFRHFSHHLRKEHKLRARQYYTKYIGEGKCKFCDRKTKFKNLNIGFRKYCSVICLNRDKAENPEYIKKLSESQKNIPRKKHTEETKQLCRELMKVEWSINREKRLKALQTEEFRKKQSMITASKLHYSKYITYINGIRCESSHERKFVTDNINSDIEISRFNKLGFNSIKIGNRWAVPDFIVNNDTIVDVKAFHHWFRKELNDGLTKYKMIETWCINNGFMFKFWFVDYGYLTIDEALIKWRVIEQKIKS
jgi:hypothetical protein